MYITGTLLSSVILGTNAFTGCYKPREESDRRVSNRDRSCQSTQEERRGKIFQQEEGGVERVRSKKRTAMKRSDSLMNPHRYSQTSRCTLSFLGSSTSFESICMWERKTTLAPGCRVRMRGMRAETFQTRKCRNGGEDQ
jgi:hypothetical protein